jgi:predicted dehydrogenase
MPFLNRRDFLRDSSLLAAAMSGAAGLSGALAEEKASRKESDRFRVAVVGVRGRGLSHVQGFAGKADATVTTICDVDEAVIKGAMEHVKKAQGDLPAYVKDVRKVVEDPNIDIVSIATPNHWHALAAIWALQNGKHVYVEKPVSHNVSEGRRIVEAARKYNRVCQAGTQIRSAIGIQEAIRFLHEGKLGKVQVARGLCYKLRPSIGKVTGPVDPPKTMDYDLWCGPAPFTKPHRNGAFGPVHYDWHWIWDYGNGDLGNQGIHQMDVARWGLGKHALPRNVFSVGGRFGYVDDGETPNTQVCVFDYGDSELIFEVRGLPSKSPYPFYEPKKKGNSVGNVFHCTDGVLVIPEYSEAIAYSKSGDVIKRFKGDGDHFGNFLKAARANDHKLLNGDILEGHLSSALCHLANISYRLGSEQTFDKTRAAFGDDKAAVETLQRTEEHLKERKLPLDETKCRVGKRLQLDPVKEVFISDREADAMLTREYRKGFEVPAKL